MSSKLLKSLLLSGLGLVGLTVALLGVGKAIAGQQKAEMDALAQEFVEQLPALETNDSARELDRLVTALGIDPSNPPYEETVHKADEKKAEALEGIRESLNDYFASQEQKTGGRLEPLPAELTAFLAQHKAELEAVKQHLATAEAPVWRQDPEDVVNFSTHIFSFFKLSHLQSLLLVEAISHSQNNQPEEMRKVLAIAQKLHGPLVQRPDLLSNLISLTMAQRQAGVLRHLEGVPVELVEQLLAVNRQASAQRALEVETWTMYREMQDLVAGDTLEQQSGEVDQLNPVQSVQVSWSAVETARVMIDHYQQLEGFNICGAEDIIEPDMNELSWWNEVGQIAIPSYASHLVKGNQRMLELELTQKVLQAKAQRQDGQWPKQLSGLESQVCPGETWIYEATPEGKMSLAFSYAFDEVATEQLLPLRYEGE